MSLFGRIYQQYRPRRGRVPGEADVSTNQPGEPFWATPNFYYFQAARRASLKQYGVGRCYLPFFARPKRPDLTAVNVAHPDNNFPLEPWPKTNLGGDRILIVAQYRVPGLEDERIIQNEHVVLGWVFGHYERSPWWDLGVFRADQLSPERVRKAGGLPYSKRYEGYLAWAPDLWLGNTGDHQLPRVHEFDYLPTELGVTKLNAFLD